MGKSLILSGTYKTKTLEEERYQEIAYFVKGIVEQYNPKYLAIETQYLTGLASNAILKTCEVKGVCRATFLMNVFGGVVYDIAPSEVKKTLCISGKRKEVKQKTIEVITVNFFENKKIDDNEADAIALGLTLIEKAKSKKV